jgi:hypothetical protein
VAPSAVAGGKTSRAAALERARARESVLQSAPKERVYE